VAEFHRPAHLPCNPRSVAQNGLRTPSQKCKTQTEYLAGELPEEKLEEKLVDWAGPFDVLQQATYFLIALRALADGKRAKAREFLQKTVDSRAVGAWNYDLATVLLEKMTEDPEWPEWIPFETEEH
jgi:hypothetical protein